MPAKSTPSGSFLAKKNTIGPQPSTRTSPNQKSSAIKTGLSSISGSLLRKNDSKDPSIKKTNLNDEYAKLQSSLSGTSIKASSTSISGAFLGKKTGGETATKSFPLDEANETIKEPNNSDVVVGQNPKRPPVTRKPSGTRTNILGKSTPSGVTVIQKITPAASRNPSAGRISPTETSNNANTKPKSGKSMKGGLSSVSGALLRKRTGTNTATEPLPADAAKRISDELNNIGAVGQQQNPARPPVTRKISSTTTTTQVKSNPSGATAIGKNITPTALRKVPATTTSRAVPAKSAPPVSMMSRKNITPSASQKPTATTGAEALPRSSPSGVALAKKNAAGTTPSNEISKNANSKKTGLSSFSGASIKAGLSSISNTLSGNKRDSNGSTSTVTSTRSAIESKKSGTSKISMKSSLAESVGTLKNDLERIFRPSTSSTQPPSEFDEPNLSITVNPNAAAKAYFGNKFNIVHTRSLIQNLLKKCANTAKQSKWLQKLYELINIYVTISNELADHINDFHRAGVDTLPILNKVRNLLIFVDFTTFDIFLYTCDSVLPLIDPEKNDMIAAHLDIAVGNSQRYIGIIEVAAKLVLDHAEQSKEISTSSNIHMEELNTSMCTLTDTISQTNSVVYEIELLSKEHMDIVNKVVRITFENTMVTSIRSLNAAHAALSLTILHILPREIERPVARLKRSGSVFEK